jgi:glycosyltransferase involved in cell wall biosynthesis
VLKIAPTSFFADYGCHVRILEETLALQKLGHQVRICTYPTGRDWPGVDVRRTPGIPGMNSVRIGSSRRKPYLDALLVNRCLVEAARMRPNLIHAHLHDGALVGYFVSRLFRVPLVFDFQGSMTSEMVDHGFLRRDGALYGPLRRLERTIDHMPEVVITSSTHAARLVVDEFGCPERKVHPVPDCVNTDAFRPRWEMPTEQKLRLRARLGIPEGRKVVVYLGLLAEYQGSSDLLNVAAAVLRHRQDVHFLIMGYPGEERYREMARTLGIIDHCTFTGCLPYELAPTYLALGDVAISPKASESEGNGKLLNYMSVGLPTLAYETSVNRELLGNEGTFAPLRDLAGLTEGLRGLLDDEERADLLGRGLRDRAVEVYSWEGGCRRVAEVYRQVTERR